MVTHNEALKTYIDVLKKAHSLNTLYIDKILALPSIKCVSYSEITEGTDVLMKIYRLNGYMRTRFINFYEEFVLTLEEKAVEYCKKYKLNYEHYKKEIDTLTNTAKDMIKKINDNLEIEPKLNVDNTVMSEYIKEMYAGIDLLVTLEHELKGQVDLAELDVLGDVMFKPFRDNKFYNLTTLLLLQFPKSNNLNVLKSDFYHHLLEAEKSKS
jgi:hypothetical protein